jgi:hypothetical protein
VARWKKLTELAGACGVLRKAGVLEARSYFSASVFLYCRLSVSISVLGQATIWRLGLNAA